MAKRRKVKISGHFRRNVAGKRVRIKGHKRAAKPKRRVGMHETVQKFKVVTYRDDQGRILSKRKYIKIR